ncbi:MAG: c-type cytochrome [Planctomycetes bacterium]|nr:c-type cytochrome [Planctomycetota bacterium]
MTRRTDMAHPIIATAVLSLLGSNVEAQSLSAELKAEAVTSLATAARQRGSAVRGAILFPQQKLGCTNCHAPGGKDLLGPDLTRMGDEATDAYLVEAMLYPSKVIKNGFESVTITTSAGKIHTGRVVAQSADTLELRDSSPDRRLIELARSDIDEMVPSKKSTMPDGFVDQLASRQEFLDLLRYMMEIKAAGPRPTPTTPVRSAGTRILSEELLGLVLLDEFQCAACHRDVLPKSKIPPKQAPDLTWGSGRINPNYIERFVADPHGIKPGTAMPDVMGTLSVAARRAAAREITHYLVSRGESVFKEQTLDSVAGQRGRELFHSVGCVACHSPRNADRTERMPDDSVPLGQLHQKYNLNGLVAFLENPHTARPSGRMPNLQLSHWEAIDITNYLLVGSSEFNNSAPPFQLDRTLADQGKLRFNELGCGQCHAMDESRSERDYPSLVALRNDKGCLSNEAGPWPRYNFSGSQVSAIRAAIERQPNALTDEQQLAVTLTTFKCTACHPRGELGGISSERNEYF